MKPRLFSTCACRETIFLPDLDRGIIIADKADETILTSFSWYIDSNRYVRCWMGDLGNQYLHCFLVGSKGPIDHANGHKSDARRDNLRSATIEENAWNSRAYVSRSGRPCASKYKGVRATKHGRWNVRISVKRNRVDLGTYATQEEAARAYDAAALRLQGQFARLNFPV